MQSYTYRELQQLLKAAKNQGLTDIKLNAKFEVLQAEYDRLYSNTETEAKTEIETTEFFAQCSRQAESDRASEAQVETIDVQAAEEILSELAIATGYAVFRAKLTAYHASKPPINPIVTSLLVTCHSFRKAAQMARSLARPKLAPVHDYAAHRNWVSQAWKAA